MRQFRRPAAPPWRLANEAGGRDGRGLPSGRADDRCRHASSCASSPAISPMCLSLGRQRFRHQFGKRRKTGSYANGH
jgi:hypothetical protein